MSFFELDGGAKKKAKKSTKPKAKTTKKAPAKKSTSGKKKTKKGGNFLGTVSELFAPAGWENFVTAAGLLALDRTDNYLRKSKDSKKQRGGDSQMEEEMTGGARKRSYSRKQRGGSDGHHTVEALDMMTTSGEEQDMTVQTGGAKKKSKSKSKTKGKGRKHKGGAMTEDQQTALYEAYKYSQSSNKTSQNATTYNTFITGLLQQLSVEVNPTNVEEAKLILDVKRIQDNLNTFSTTGANNNSTRGVSSNPSTSSTQPNAEIKLKAARNKLNSFYRSQNSLFGNGNSLRQANATEPIPITGRSFTNNRAPPSNTVFSNTVPSNNSLQFGPMSPLTSTNAALSGGGKTKTKPKSSTKKTKAKKAPKKK